MGNHLSKQQKSSKLSKFNKSDTLKYGLMHNGEDINTQKEITQKLGNDMKKYGLIK
jgi:hypothetical protein